MKRDMSTSAKVRRLIDKGYTNKAIVEKLGCKPQAVYNIRYQVNKERGLGAIGKPAPTPAEGIGAPPKRTRKTKPAGTGITSAPQVGDNVGGLVLTEVDSGALRWVRGAPALQGAEPYAITMIEPEPSLWERIKRFFKGN